jgi:hypothetical protein
MASQKLHQLVSLLEVLLVFLGQAMETNGELSHCDYPIALRLRAKGTRTE